MNDEKLQGIRHSLAHLLAATVIEIYPGARNAIGPAIENGFYQDFETLQPISEEDFPKIEAKMREKLKTWETFERKEVDLEEARKQFAWNPYKLELIEEFAQGGKQLTFYRSGDFIDLCKGGHADDVRDINPDAFKLTKVSGAYWRGDEHNQQLQRIYGVAFATKEELDDYLKRLEEAKLRDHRILGEQLKIFTISEEVGKGLPLMLPRGAMIKNLLSRYMRQLEEGRGYQYVDTPVITHERLYQRSGHAKFYADDMFTIIDAENQKFYVSPMNCPHHHQIYEKLVLSYNDLPLRLAEHSGLYRHELSGALTGLIRVRGPITQNDAHIYVTKDQLKAEFIAVLQLFQEVYKEFGIDDYWYRLSLPDFQKDKYEGEASLWEESGQIIREAMQELGVKFVEAEGEAAFYGPKIDVQTRNVLGKEDSIATSQVDILVPGRMGLTYVDAESKAKHPIVIHRAILGSIERFMGFYLEKTAGWLPFWLAPEQVRILTINDTVVDYVEEIKNVLKGIVLEKPLRHNELRFTVDARNESLGRKIRESASLKIPVQLIVGPKDKEAREVSVRTQPGEEKVKLDQLAEYLRAL